MEIRPSSRTITLRSRLMYSMPPSMSSYSIRLRLVGTGGGPRTTASSAIEEPTSKYCSISEGSSSSALLTLSKPSMLPSGGSKSSGPSLGGKVTPSRSRTVLVYSVRFRRRISTLPPVLCAFDWALRSSAAIQRATGSISEISGIGSSSGGMSPRLMLSITSIQCPADSESRKSVFKVSRRRLPFCLSGP